MLIRTLNFSDIPAALCLTAAAGWNQTAQDWQNLIHLAPQGCFGLEYDGVLAATTTAVCYGRELAWIGMVLTDRDYRRRGFARRLMEHALGYLEQQQVQWIKLDATEMGRPLYQELGFRDECPIERWVRSGRDALGCSRPPDPLGVFDPALDRIAFGAPRTDLLKLLAPIGSASLAGSFAMCRPGANAYYFGPCVSRSAEDVRELLRSFLVRHGQLDMYWDLLPGNAHAVDLAHEHGFERARELVRMVRPGTRGAPALVHNDGCVFAIAGFEYG